MDADLQLGHHTTILPSVMHEPRVNIPSELLTIVKRGKLFSIHAWTSENGSSAADNATSFFCRRYEVDSFINICLGHNRCCTLNMYSTVYIVQPYE